MHESIDIRYRHQYLYYPAVEWLCYRELIEVTRVIVVHRRPQQVAQIANIEVRRRGGRDNGVGLIQGRRGEIR